MKNVSHPKYQTALGISTGDQIRTSCGTGGIVTGITNPHYVDDEFSRKIISTWPVINVTYDGVNPINNIRQDGDRWFTDDNDEIHVAHGTNETQQQMDMFSSVLEAPEPYRFQEGVDYSHNAWSCDQCGDFNAEPENYNLRWHCVKCGRYGVKKLILMLPRDQTTNRLNSYLLALGYEEQTK